jgi:3-hydroxybutyryl-CoA dehydrogenase
VNVERIAVIGAGLMGHGIAQDFALAGFPVRLHDQEPDCLKRAPIRIEENLRRLAARGLFDANRIPGALERISVHARLEDAIADADLVIEAVFEDLPLKQDLFARIESVCSEQAIIASNTSSLMPSRLAQRLKHPARLVIAHYFNPAYLIPLVEIVPGPATSEATVRIVAELLTKLGKRPVVLRKEATGFVANRLQLALFREAISIVERGIAAPEDVDRVVRYGFGRRLAAAGPFEVFDLAGLDTILAVASQILPDVVTAEAAARPVPESFRKAVERGDLGVKTGRGFREWPPDAVEDLRDRLHRALCSPQPSEEIGPA